MTSRGSHAVRGQAWKRGTARRWVLALVLVGCERDPRAQRVQALETAERAQAPVRVASFNASLTRAHAGGLRRELAGGASVQARQAAAIVQRVRPDVLLLLEVDRDPEALAILERDYLAVPQPDGGDGLTFAHRFVPATNTGLASGLDLDHDGRTDGPGDALGYGAFPGQYGMVVLSRHPIDIDGIRCFGDLRWRDVDGARLPDDPVTPAPADWYSEPALDVLPLSSKNHCIVPISIEGQPGPLHLLLSHPVPPVFDGPEDRNGLRNHDEIRLWAQLLDGAPGLPVLLPSRARFVLAGDLNADPHDGDTTGDPVGRWLLGHPRIAAEPVPASTGSIEASRRDGGANASHSGPASHDTADFPDVDGGPGNLRVDYVLPSKSLEVLGAGVFWPAAGEPGVELVACSDHRLVWIDVR
ncbi:endonuclease/exonuclease/phosphatase family protein [Paraliomyxa miuraensis]|uniref:endonuclease/exonuclease/phosphatase family protein n=1 Tax=Paraliomyxa miuraensis TaxID=376150 RepID=UPI002250E4B2|nr:endonuclease/exonuclease/phosphatase family protein [Paraliomyxa miuraensis]MCX4246504.1 endonuclease/exonuclease/phosphatase family protein [Paraliomyxa miuraensis]